MAPIIYIVLQVLLRLRLVLGQSGVSITLTAPINPVEEENMLSIHCQVHQLKVNKHVVEIKRHVAGSPEQRVTLEDRLFVEDTEERFFLAQRRIQNSMVFFLSIIDIKRELDEGVYYCIIRDQQTLQEITRESVNVSFKYFPADIYPECYPSDYSAEIVMDTGQQMKINCTSELGNPDIEIEWTRNDEPIDTATENTLNGNKILHLTFKTSSEDNGAIYVCKITSVAFPDEMRSCHVGPFKIKLDPNTVKKPSADIETNNKGSRGFELTTIAPRVDSSSNNKNDGPTYITTECNDVCDENILYWIIATVIAGTLAIVFCIIGIVIFVRYRRRRKEDKKRREKTRNSHYQNREAIYAEVDTRPQEGTIIVGGPRGDTNENKLYMALDKATYVSTVGTSRASPAATTSTTVSPMSPEREPLNNPPQLLQQHLQQQGPQQQQHQQSPSEDPYTSRKVTHTTFGL